MPWCETCAQYRQPAALGDGGACPECGTVIGTEPKAPWHFKLLVVAVAVYLGWRLWQLTAWLVHKL